MNTKETIEFERRDEKMMGLIERVEEAELLEDAKVWDYYRYGNQVTVSIEFGGGKYCGEVECSIDIDGGVMAHMVAVSHEDNIPISKHLEKEVREWVVDWLGENK